MGLHRNGARTMLDLMARACRLSRLPGFRIGLNTILGTENATTFMGLWEPLCLFIDGLVALDNFYNQKDAADTDDTGEDFTPGA